MSHARRSRVAWLQLGLVVVLFGLAWPVIRIGLSAGTPLWLAAARATLSAATAISSGVRVMSASFTPS